MKLNVSLYIPIYNGESTIESVLKSVFKLSPGPDEIIIINDGSKDKTLSILEKYTDQIKIVNNERNMGLAYSRNKGISESKNEDVASLDADVEVNPDWLNDLVNIKKKYSSAITGGKLREKYKDRSIYDQWRHFHATQNSFGERDIDNLERPLAGSNTLLSKSAWKRVGGYENQYKTNGEDATFCQKLLNLNFKISYSAKAISYHLRTDNLKSLADSSRRGYIYGAGLKQPTLMRFLQRSIRHFKGFLINSYSDLIKMRFALIYVGFMIFINHVKKEFLGLIKKKADYV